MIDENKLKEQMFSLVEQIGDERLHIDAVVQLIDDAPTVDAVPVRHGKWKHKKDLKQFFCDQCGEPSLTEDDVYFYDMEFPNFCPNCGARMDGEHDTGRTEQATC